MSIPVEFTNDTNWKALQNAIHAFGHAEDVLEDDLLAALRDIEAWRQRFMDPFTINNRGEQITWHRYEILSWTLGESLRQIMRRTKRLRKSERVFASVRAICFDARFGKGRESFVMLLGRYGGSSQITALIGLLDDADVCGHAIYALRLLGAVEAAEKVAPYLNSHKTWVRQEAQKYFEKLEKVTQKTPALQSRREFSKLAQRFNAGNYTRHIRPVPNGLQDGVRVSRAREQPAGKTDIYQSPEQLRASMQLTRCTHVDSTGVEISLDPHRNEAAIIDSESSTCPGSASKKNR